VRSQDLIDHPCEHLVPELRRFSRGMVENLLLGMMFASSPRHQRLPARSGAWASLDGPTCSTSRLALRGP